MTPFGPISTLVGALAYFVRPLDAVPDVLPGVGFTDDAAVLLAALRMVAGHLRPEHHAAARRKAHELIAHSAASHVHDQLAHDLPVRQRLERRRRLGERIGLLDVA
jgi:uncharacterized membrane protein YkvA (DUF1232 family)